MSILTELSPQLEAAQKYINHLSDLDQHPDAAEQTTALASIQSVILSNATVYEGIRDSGILYDSEFVQHIECYPHGLIRTLRTTLDELLGETSNVYMEKRYDGS
jgi:hypothetical protein